MKRTVPTRSLVLLLLLCAAWLLVNGVIVDDGGPYNVATFKWAYAFNTVILPVILLCVAGTYFFAFMTRKQKSLAAWGTGYVLAAAALFTLHVYATRFEPYQLQVRHVEIPTEKLMQPLRILHISDVQSAAIGRYERETYRRMRDLKPDLVLGTGDNLQPVPPATIASELPKLLAMTSELAPPMGYYSVFGETDEPLQGLPASDLAPLNVLNVEDRPSPSRRGYNLYFRHAPRLQLRSVAGATGHHRGR